MTAWNEPESTDELFDRARNVLVGLAFLSEARTGGYDNQGAHGKSESTAPTGNDDGSEHDHVRHGLVKWLRWAEEKLQAQRVKPPTATRELRDIILTDHKGKTTAEVAAIEKVSASYVLKVRQGKR